MTVAPEGRKMLRPEVGNAETPIERKPEWIKTRAKMGPEYNELMKLLKGEGLHTVCQEAGCPNIFECWEDREATFLTGGEFAELAIEADEIGFAGVVSGPLVSSSCRAVSLHKHAIESGRGAEAPV